METKERSGLSVGAIISIVIICAVVLSILVIILGGIAISRFSGCDGSFGREDVPFEEMEYTRPDSKAIMKKMNSAVSIVKANSEPFSTQIVALKDALDGYEDINTMYSIAMIKNSIDTTDEFYADEMDFFAEFMPVYYQKIQDIYVACAQSPNYKDFESKFFGKGALDEYKNGSKYTDKSVELMQRIEELRNEYTTKSANPFVDVDGERIYINELDFDSMTPQKTAKIMLNFYDKYNKELGEIYVSLVKSNMVLAKELGYDSYAEYAYEGFQREYTPEDGEKYCEDIKEYFVPLFKRVSEDGLYEEEQNVYSCTEDDVLGALATVTGVMGGYCDSAYEYMMRNNLYNFEQSVNKATSTYTTYIQKYDAPFIVTNPSGNIEDITDTFHEFGHFTDKYINYGYDSGLDCDETASQALEYLCADYLEYCLTDEEVEHIKKTALLEAIDVFVYQGYYSELETRIYALDYTDVTIENINKIAYECAHEYGIDYFQPWEGYYGVSWVDIPHLYESPFYMLSYCVSLDSALQVYFAEDCDRMDLYYDLIDWDWDMTYIENLERVELVSPFAENGVENRANQLESLIYEE